MKIKRKKTKQRTKTKAKKPAQKNTDELISIILLSDSAGYRMKSYGPVCLVNISNRKLIDIQIQAINKIFPKNEIIVCGGFEVEKIVKYLQSKYKTTNIRVVENQLYNNSNSCESIRLALNNTFNDKILICDGNLLFESKVLKLINKNTSCALAEKHPSKNMEIGINIDASNNIQHFSFGAKHIWSEMLFLHNSEIIDDFRKIVNNLDNKNKFMFEVLNELISINYNIALIENTYSIEKINNIKTYHCIKE